MFQDRRVTIGNLDLWIYLGIYRWVDYYIKAENGHWEIWIYEYISAMKHS